MDSIVVYQGNNSITAKDITHLKAISIGRNDLNDIPLSDPSVSRFHAAIFRDDEGNCFLQDLGSRNNTYVNKKRRDYGTLNEGDSIEIGDYPLVLTKQIDKSQVKKAKIAPYDQGTDDEAKTIFSPLSPQRKEIGRLKYDAKRLLLLYQLSRLANLNEDTEDALQLIIEELAEAFHPGRIFIALLEQEGASLTCLARFPKEESEIKISRNMIRYLLKEKQTLITNDAITDERLKKDGSPARSILEMQVKSAICLPLQWDKEIKGILYMDSSKEKRVFTEEDASLLSLVAIDISSLIERGMNFRAVKDEKIRLENLLKMGNAIIGISPATKDILKSLEKIGSAEATVLITGETGTGKDLAAKVIHYNSRRRGKPFIQVNCAAIPENLLESLFFGVVANFPGFHNKLPLKGKFELAHGGTIFLNEIGELSPGLQARLLDVLEDEGEDKKIKKIWPLGAEQPIPVDVRIIAATNRDLEQEVAKGNFRQDLYERLNIFPVHLPPLRERREDLPLLAGYFLYQLRQEYGKPISRFSNTCIEFLSAYEWPGNIRELKNAIERAVIRSDRSLITRGLFDLKKDELKKRPKSLKEVEKEHIERVLEYTEGNKEASARILGIAKQTLYNKGEGYHLPGFDKS